MPRRTTLTAAVVALGLLTGCSFGGTSPEATSSSTSGTTTQAGGGNQAVTGTSQAPTPTPVATPLAVTLGSAHGTKAMLPTDSLTVSAASGTVTAVVVTDAKGTTIPGTLTGTTWKPARNLIPKKTYTATITGTNSLGQPQTVTRTFSTIQDTISASYDILYSGNEVGVGMPATIQFASSVTTKAMRAEIEKHAKITVTPAQQGSWGWLDDRQLMWRPNGFFKPGTKITVTTNFAGLQTGENKWVNHDDSSTMTIGDQRILYTDIKNHTLRATRNGETLRTIPATNGKEGFSTRSGTKVIIERLSSTRMDSTTVDIPAGSPDSYSLDVKWAMRLTWTGEFIHAAPWSVGSQGEDNVSHGCTGVSTSNAEWLFNFARAGDLNIVSGSDRIMKPTEGIGVWQYSYAQWVKQSALA